MDDTKVRIKFIESGTNEVVAETKWVNALMIPQKGDIVHLTDMSDNGKGINGIFDVEYRILRFCQPAQTSLNNGYTDHANVEVYGHLRV